MTETILPSIEVVGKLSPNQQEELNFIAGQIVSSESLNTSETQDLDHLREVIRDCIERGLALRSKVWVTPVENLFPIFQDGLSQRESLVDRLKKYSGNLHTYNLLNSKETALLTTADQLNPLSQDLTEVEILLQTIKEREDAVSAFLKTIFDQESLQDNIKVLKKEAGPISIIDLNDKLFANFLVHLALYRRPGVKIDPKDVAALEDLWKNPTVRAESQKKLVDALPNEASKVYTQAILNSINFTLEGLTDLDSLKDSHNFIFETEAMLEEAKDFEEEISTVYVSNEELDLASKKYTELLELNSAFESLATDSDEQSEEQMGAGKYFEVLQNLSPLELLMAVKLCLGDPKVNSIVFLDDLKELTAFKTVLGALNLVFARLQLSSPELNIFEEEQQQKTANILREWVLTALLQNREPLEEALDKLPSVVLLEILTKIKLESLNKDQKQAILNLDQEILIKLVSEADLSLEANLNYSLDKLPTLDNILFPPGSENLLIILKALSKDKQERIIQSLWKIIRF